MTGRLLLVDADPARAAEHARVLSALGEACEIVAEAEAVGALYRADVLLVDVEQAALVDEVRRSDSLLPVVALVGPGNLDRAAHLLGVERLELLATPCGPAGYAAALATARLRATAIAAAAETSSARRLLELSDEVARIARAMALGETERRRPPPAAETDETVDARAVRAMIAARRLREEHLPVDLFGEPAWDMLLDLTAARIEGTNVSVTDLTIAAAVPTTTALRYIKTMVEWGLLTRRPDGRDGRRVFIELGDAAFARMRGWFAAARKAGLNM